MIQESLSNMKILQIYTAENRNIERFSRLQNRYMDGYIKEIKFKITRIQIDTYCQFFIFLIIIWLGGYLVLNDQISTTRLLSFFTGIVLLVEPVVILTKIYSLTFQSTASIDRIKDYLTDESTISTTTPTSDTPLNFHDIDFKRVCFKYSASTNNILSNVSFRIKEGDFLGIVGPSGAGKSTLIHLITRFYELNSGEILIDGKNIQSLSTQTIRENVAYVPQESLLSKALFLDNYRIGNPNATVDEVINALKLSNAWEFVNELPDKLLTRIGTQGLTLSGGQRQRLSIARAIISNPKLLILDEATSALDSHSERKIQDAIHSLKGQFTIVVIAHRLSTIKDSSNIIFIDNGEIKESNYPFSTYGQSISLL